MNWLAKQLGAGTSPHWFNRLLGVSKSRSAVAVEDDCVCFYIPDKSRGWILEAACREIASRLEVPTVFCGSAKALPAASAYFFCHYHFYVSALRINPWLAHENCVVWFTHPKEPDLGGSETIAALRHATVVSMSSKWRQYLIELGLDASRVKTIVGAADPTLFQSHPRGQGKIGFCTAYYARKNPDRILEIVQLVPEYQFVLLGRNWEEYSRFDELRAQANFEYRQASYAEYPAFYSELDVFISASQLEGGPIPLLESMMSNVVPVASDTGFSTDVIRHSENGFLFAAEGSSSQEIATLVRKAKVLPGDIRATVIGYSWDAYAAEHAAIFKAA